MPQDILAKDSEVGVRGGRESLLALVKYLSNRAFHFGGYIAGREDVEQRHFEASLIFIREIFCSGKDSERERDTGRMSERERDGEGGRSPIARFYWLS